MNHMKNEDSLKLEKCIHDTQKRIFDSSSTFDNLFLKKKLHMKFVFICIYI